MNKNMLTIGKSALGGKNKKMLLLILFVLVFFAVPLVSQAADAPAPTNNAFNYTPMEKIPGFETEVGDFYIYIQAVYKFGIWAVGIAALLMISIGGFMYITSAGNNTAIGKAKGVIADAVIGLVLALTAYLLLYIINPDLVKIKPLPIIKAKPVAVAPPVGPPPGVTPEGAVACSAVPSQVPAQCFDASPSLSNLISCISQKTNGGVQISSISDGNGGLNCYRDHPTWPQCPSSGGSNCCYHAKDSCHYGGTCSDGSHAVDFSYAGSSANANEIQAAAAACSGKTNPEGNHLHVSIGSCCTL